MKTLYWIIGILIILAVGLTIWRASLPKVPNNDFVNTVVNTPVTFPSGQTPDPNAKG